MVRHGRVERQATEPAIGQVEAHFLAQTAFRRDAVEAADQRHADQQFRRGVRRSVPQMASSFHEGQSASLKLAAE